MNVKSGFVHSTDYAIEYIEGYFKSRLHLDNFKLAFWLNLIFTFPFAVFFLKSNNIAGASLFMLLIGGLIAFLSCHINLKAREASKQLCKINNEFYAVEIVCGIITSTVDGVVINKQSIKKLKKHMLQIIFFCLSLKIKAIFQCSLKALAMIRSNGNSLEKW